MDLFKCFRKCFLCGQRGDELKKISYKVYHSNCTHSTVYFAYHPVCLKFVLCEPEKYSHEKVNTALQIAFAIKRQKKQKEEENLEIKKEHQKNIEKAKKLCKVF